MDNKDAQIAELTARLKKQEEDLQSFVYTVSHDLHAPLRHIEGFSRRLFKRNFQHFDEKSLSDVEFINDSIRLSQNILAAILEYSRLATRQKPFAEVELTAVVEEVLNDESSRLKELRAAVSLDSLPVVRGDRIQLKRLFEYLLDNALKYHRPHCPPEIEISQLPSDDDVCITIKDAGMGIPEKRQSQVFDIFKRAVDADEYPGLGVGLSLAKRIAELHGGSLGLRSEEGLGTCLTITLPANDA